MRSLPMERAVFVYTTWPSIVEAESVGRALVEKRFAACVNILPGMISHYWWQGQVERAEEVVAIFKTRASLAEPLRQAIKDVHSYQTPSIVILPVESADSEYYAWILKETEGGYPPRAPAAIWTCRRPVAERRLTAHFRAHSVRPAHVVA